MKRNDINIIIAVVLVVFASMLRLWSADLHLYNFTPIAAIGLFSGYAIRNNKAIAFFTPLAGQFLADLFFEWFTTTPGFYPGQYMNYIAIAVATVLGFAINNGNISASKQDAKAAFAVKQLRMLGFLVGASTVFFIVSNLGYFLSGFNGYSFNGLLKTYIDAIPFYKNSLTGDLVGGSVLFAVYSILHRPVIVTAPQYQ